MNKFSKRFLKPTEDQLRLHFRRFEFKYPLHLTQYLQIKRIVASRLQIDNFAQPQGNYTIESTYFDTPHLTSYQQARDGIKNRVKYRLRTYPSTLNRTHYVFWEIKQKKDMTVFKDRSIVNPLRSLKLLKRSYKGKTDRTLKKFLYAKNRYLLTPKILVRYRREPFVQHTPELRITFDSDIQVSKVNSQWNVGEQTQQIFPQSIIMEIKFTGSLPFWLAEVVRVHNLERQPFSKYAFSIEKVKSHLSWITS